jgi:hypothetical protein
MTAIIGMESQLHRGDLPRDHDGINAFGHISAIPQVFQTSDAPVQTYAAIDYMMLVENTQMAIDWPALDC